MNPVPTPTTHPTPTPTPTPTVTAPLLIELVPAKLPTEDDEAYWHVWRDPIARTLRPVLEELQANLPGTNAHAVALTCGGQQICSTAPDPSQTQQLATHAAHAYAWAAAALNHIASHATTRDTPPNDSADDVRGTGPYEASGTRDLGGLDALTFAGRETRAVMVDIADLIVGNVLLWACADEANLGVITFQTKAAAEKISGLLAREDPGPHESQQ